MYIQITTKCNMLCPHCCFSCTNNGAHMTERTFRKACEFAYDTYQNIFLGGGEPTLHPEFEKFLGIGLLNSHYTTPDMKLGLVTNGTNKDLTLKLLDLPIYINVSYDKYHDQFMVNPEVYHKAKALNLIRDVSKINITNNGRAKNLIDIKKEDYCPCDDLFIDVWGDIYQCGCMITKLGNVLNDDANIIDFSNIYYGCEKENGEKNND